MLGSFRVVVKHLLSNLQSYLTTLAVTLQDHRITVYVYNFAIHELASIILLFRASLIVVSFQSPRPSSSQ